MSNGIISGFIGGMGKGAADAGKILLMNNLNKERDEANDLRNRQLRQDLQEDRQIFLAGDRRVQVDADTARDTARTDAAAEAAEKKVETDATAAEQTQKDKLAQIEHTAKYAAPKNAQKIKYTDPGTGYEQEGVLVPLGSGKYRIEKPDTGEVLVKVITSEELKNRQAIMDDGKPWYAGSTSKKEARASIVNERDAAAAAKPGIVDSAKTETPPEGTKLKKNGKTYIIKNGKVVPLEG